MKLNEFENPLSGQKGSIFDFGKIWSLVLGVGVILLVVNVGQKVASTVASKLPGGGYAGLDQPLVKQAQQTGEVKRIYQ